MKGDCTLRQGERQVRAPRLCSNRHQLRVGDRVRFWTGRVEGMFSTYEECDCCVAEGSGWLSARLEQEAACG